jgi:hypothetical protein
MAAQAEAVPPAKRPRLEEDVAEDAALVDIPDSEVWFSDGNIIIASVDDVNQQRHLFKCHRAVLARRLSALEDMFEAGAIADSASASEQFGGLPVVRLYDPHEDVKALLRATYNPTSVTCVLRRCGNFDSS